MGAIVLASASPRRRALLEGAGFVVMVRAPHVDESRDPTLGAVAWARSLAVRKARTGPPDKVIVAADTVVHVGDAVFDKPADRAEAVAHLRALADQWHSVTTGVCVRKGDDEQTFHATTAVRFRALPDAEIAAYVATGEADDKAGAYGIQGRAGAFVAELRGSYTNVVGLPLEAVITALAGRGVTPWR